MIEPKLRDLIIMLILLFISGQLIGEYIFNRDVNGWIQAIVISAWLTLFITILASIWNFIRKNF